MILIDAQLPATDGAGDGYSVTRQIRRLEAGAERDRVPVIGLVAEVVRNQRDHCYEYGLDDFLVKPFRKEDLLNTMAKWVDSRPVILVVDDVPEIRNLTCLFLRTQANYRVVAAASAGQALEIFGSRDISLVVVSLEMREFDGLKTAGRFRAL